MNENIILTIIEFIASVIIEGIILGFIFQMISNRSDTQMKQALQDEMNNIEKQNKFNFEQLQSEIRQCKREVISQIKEASKIK